MEIDIPRPLISAYLVNLVIPHRTLEICGSSRFDDRTQHRRARADILMPPVSFGLSVIYLDKPLLRSSAVASVEKRFLTEQADTLWNGV